MASDLQISQALLSHYENGAREPGLEFVCRACDYYGVSADYLLGRTGARNNFSAMISELSVNADTLLGAMTASLAASSRDREMTVCAEKYLGGALFRLLSELMPAGENSEGFDELSMALCLMSAAESRIKRSEKRGEIEDETLLRCAEEFTENTKKQLAGLYEQISYGEAENERSE